MTFPLGIEFSCQNQSRDMEFNASRSFCRKRSCDAFFTLDFEHWNTNIAT